MGELDDLLARNRPQESKQAAIEEVRRLHGKILVPVEVDSSCAGLIQEFCDRLRSTDGVDAYTVSLIGKRSVHYIQKKLSFWVEDRAAKKMAKARVEAMITNKIADSRILRLTAGYDPEYEFYFIRLDGKWRPAGELSSNGATTSDFLSMGNKYVEAALKEAIVKHLK